MALTAVATWILDNSYGPVPASSTTAPVRTPKVSLVDGLYVEESTTNLSSNPNLTGTLGFAPSGWTGVVVDNTRAFSGTTSGKATGGASVSQTAPYSAASGTTYTASIRLWLTTAPTTVGLTNVAAQMTTPGGFKPNVWQTWTVTFTPSSVVSVGFSLTGITGWVGASQIEALGYATSYCDGSLGSGYSWTTPANAPNTTSTRQSGAITWNVPALTSGWSVCATLRIGDKANSRYYIYTGASNFVSMHLSSTSFGFELTNNGSYSVDTSCPALNPGDVLTVGAVYNSTAGTLTIFGSINGVIQTPATTSGVPTGLNVVASTLSMSGNDEALEQILIYQQPIASADFATIAAGGMDISIDPRIVFAAASSSTAGTTGSQSTLGTGTKRGRLTSFNTYGPVEPVPLTADSNTPGGGLATFRVAAQNGSGVGVGDQIGFSQNPTTGTYAVVGVQAAPGQYDELYLVKAN